MTLRGISRAAHAAFLQFLGSLPIPWGERGLNALNRSLKRIQRTAMVRTRFGFTMHCELDDFIQSRIFHFGHWEPNVSNAIWDTLKPGDLLVDVGANVGYDSLLAASRVGPAGAVVAIEAAPDTYDVLRKNIALNGFANIRAVNLAVSDAPGMTSLYMVSRTNCGAASTIRSRGSTLIAEIQTAPLDSILTADERRRTRLIKIDIEGAELPVLRRLLSTLDDYPPDMQVLVEMSGANQTESIQVFEQFLAAGFTAFGIENEYGCDWYLRWRRSPPLAPLTSLPEIQTDILFRRPPVTQGNSA